MDPLPPEVTDRIIDFLWADRASLRSCALTCRSWLPASRFHLFRTLRIWSREAFDALIHKSCIPETAEMFRFVQHLSIRERSGSFAHLVPHILVNKLPNVTSIDIHDFSVWAVSPDAGFFSILSRFKGVKALELRNVQFSTIHEMAILLCSFPSLSRLSLHSCNLIGDLLGPPVHLPPLRTLSLTHLTVDAGSMGIVTSELFLEWLLQTPTTRTLQTFKVVTGYLANVMAISGILTRLIHGLGDTLRAITISLSTSVDEQESLMSTSSGLRTIYLRFNADTHATAALHLEHVISAQVRIVELQFEAMSAHLPLEISAVWHLSEPVSLQFRDIRPSLRSIDTILVSDSFPTIEQVIIRSRHEPFPELSSMGFRQKTQRALGRVHRRGILKFVSAEDEVPLT